MNNLKSKIALWLCIILTFPVIANALPMRAVEVQAAETTPIELRDDFGWECDIWDQNIGAYRTEVEIEVNQSFDASEYIYYSAEGYHYLCDVKNEKYNSSKKSIASVDSKGIIKTKKTGTTTITVSYKGSSISFDLKVVKSGKLGSKTKKYKNLMKKIEQLEKAYNGKVTSKNAYSVMKLKREINDARNAFVDSKGFKMDGEWSRTNKLLMPEMKKAQKIFSAASSFAANNNPIGTTSSKWFKISKITAKKDERTFTITLNKKVTKSQMIAMKYFSGDYIPEENEFSAFSIYVVDTKTGYRYNAKAYVTQGSNKLTVCMDNLALKKGRTYRLIAADWSKHSDLYGWTKGKTFKIK